MSETVEFAQEAVEQAGSNKINSMVAIFVALTATFMAICNVKDGNLVQAMSQAQVHALDTWSYFQAKSTKQALAENTLAILKIQEKASNDELIAKYEAQIARYEKEKTTLKQKAEAYEKEYDDLNVFDDQYDATEALLTVAIAMFGIAALTQKKWLLGFASAISLLGLVYGLAAFLQTSLHSDFLSKILG